MTGPAPCPHGIPAGEYCPDCYPTEARFAADDYAAIARAMRPAAACPSGGLCDGTGWITVDHGHGPVALVCPYCMNKAGHPKPMVWDARAGDCGDD